MAESGDNVRELPAGLAQGITGGVQLRNQETVVKVVMPDKDEIAKDQEAKLHYQENVKNEAAHFDKSNLKPTETQVKDILPSKEDYQQAKDEKHLHCKTIEGFNRRSLSHVEPDVKLVSPSAQEFKEDQEYKQHYQTKVKDAVRQFDATQLKHTEPVVKTVLDVLDGSK